MLTAISPPYSKFHELRFSITVLHSYFEIPIGRSNHSPPIMLVLSIYLRSILYLQLEIPWLQFAEYPAWVIFLGDLLQFRMILRTIPIKDALIMGSIILIDVSKVKSHRFCQSVGSADCVVSSCHHFVVVAGVAPLNRNIEYCGNVRRISKL
jgi:hypothetical protein